MIWCCHKKGLKNQNPQTRAVHPVLTRQTQQPGKIALAYAIKVLKAHSPFIHQHQQTQ